MSSRFTASSSTADERWLGGKVLGTLIRGARERCGLSIRQAAYGLGMTVAQWKALEEGKAPETEEEFVMIIQALEVPQQAIQALAFFYLGARGRSRRRAMDIVARCTHSRISSPQGGR